MKTRINPPTKSKINAVAGTGAIVNAIGGLAMAQGWITPEMAAELGAVVNAALFVLAWIFRTWFTEPSF